MKNFIYTLILLPLVYQGSLVSGENAALPVPRTDYLRVVATIRNCNDQLYQLEMQRDLIIPIRTSDFNNLVLKKDQQSAITCIHKTSALGALGIIIPTKLFNTIHYATRVYPPNPLPPLQNVSTFTLASYMKIWMKTIKIHPY